MGPTSGMSLKFSCPKFGLNIFSLSSVSLIRFIITLFNSGVVVGVLIPGCLLSAASPGPPPWHRLTRLAFWNKISFIRFGIGQLLYSIWVWDVRNVFFYFETYFFVFYLFMILLIKDQWMVSSFYPGESLRLRRIGMYYTAIAVCLRVYF